MWKSGIFLLLKKLYTISMIIRFHVRIVISLCVSSKVRMAFDLFYNFLLYIDVCKYKYLTR